MIIMKKSISLVCILAATMLVGCASVKREDFSSAGVGLRAAACFKPRVEILNNGKLVYGTATIEKFWIFTTKAPNAFARQMGSGSGGRSLSKAEEAAMYVACADAGATMLIAPRFTETCESSGIFGWNKKITVTVEGVPAKIVGAEEVPLSDVGNAIQF